MSKTMCQAQKVCTQCLTEKPLDEFYEGRGKLGRRAACKACCNKSAQAHWAKESERYKAYNRGRRDEMSTYLRRYNLFRYYKMSVEQYDEMLVSQGGVCALCGRPPTSSRRLAVDHDHACCPGKETCGGCVRGLLCGNCNKCLGVLENDEWTTLAHDYLERQRR